MKDTWKDYFAFNRKQRNGILVLCSLIGIMLLYLLISDYFPVSEHKTDFSAFKNELAKAGSNSNTSGSNKPAILLDVNSADSLTIKALPEMNAYCARMMVRYRNKLGGYYSILQLKEVYGMDSSKYNAIKGLVRIDTNEVRKIDINSATEKELSSHPYIRYYLAKAIVNYREQHGAFKSLAGLHNIVAIDDTTFSKIAPYLETGKK